MKQNVTVSLDHQTLLEDSWIPQRALANVSMGDYTSE